MKRNQLMNKNIYSILSLILLLCITSCSDSYNIQGTSNVSTFDGRMLYLKILKNNEFKNIDSCDVVHGQFAFSGTVDSVRMANIFMDDESVLPLVIEGGDITVKIDNTQQIVSGTPLNDKLFKFLKKFNQLESEKYELVHRHDKALMDGLNEYAINRKLNAEAMRIDQQEDQLLTTFVCDNFDNVLGPGVFFMRTINSEYPVLNPWIEDIMSKATDKFKNDPYVKDYYQKAQENQDIMNGMKEPQGMNAQQDQMAPPQAPDGAQGPTPNDMAKPTAAPGE